MATRATLFPPPQLTGNPDADVPAMGEYLQQIYRTLGLEPNGYRPNGWDTGSFTIADTETTAEIAFPESQTDDEYSVTFGCEESSSGVDTDALKIAGYSRTAEGFTVRLAAAPGSGESVTFTYHVRR